METVDLPRRPERFSTGIDLAVSTYHVQQTGGVFTICRTVGPNHWYPLSRRENPAWRTWPNFAAAQDQIDRAEDLCDYPFWGR